MKSTLLNTFYRSGQHSKQSENYKFSVNYSVKTIFFTDFPKFFLPSRNRNLWMYQYQWKTDFRPSLVKLKMWVKRNKHTENMSMFLRKHWHFRQASAKAIKLFFPAFRTNATFYVFSRLFPLKSWIILLRTENNFPRLFPLYWFFLEGFVIFSASRYYILIYWKKKVWETKLKWSLNGEHKFSWNIFSIP